MVNPLLQAAIVWTAVSISAGGDLREEIKNAKNHVITYSISDFFEEDFFLEKKILYLVK